ncbi:MAG TPA: molybdopterin converting factor subunit 1 [Micropepsaceae bacterium]|nr:molybdopterin converting factor subunit 1 [Micropepsaceae bacterium]HRK71223.1 molybdopterin converting factor subunit 1 [Micropepsaceae bacterium]
MTRRLRVLYFAWLREKTGTRMQEIDLPADITTPRALAMHLASLSAGHKAAFENLARIKLAINQQHAGLDDPLTDAHEIAFFPPVTGG